MSRSDRLRGLRRTPKRLLKSFVKRTAPFLCPLYVHLVRAADWLGGPRLVSLLLLPVVLGDLLRRLPNFAHFAELQIRLPPEIRRERPLFHYFRMIRAWQETLAAALLYDRLDSSRWAARMTFTGMPPDQSDQSKNRPVILVFLHTGGFAVLRYWLRSRGVPVAALARALPLLLTDYAQNIRERGDCRYGLKNVAHIFSNQSLRAALRFLQPGYALAVALDGGAVSDRPVPCSVPGGTLYLKDGAVRLARLNHSFLVPVSVHHQSPFRFEFRFGAPVADALMAAENTQPAMDYLARELWQNLERDPGAIGWSTLEALTPSPAADRMAWP